MTLVELVVVIAVTALLFSAITAGAVFIYQTQGYTIAQSYEIDNARRGMQEFVRDAREMTPSDTGTFPVAVTQNHRFGFYSDIDQDDSVEYIEYVLSSTTLRKFTYAAVGTPPVYDLVNPVATEILSEYVQNISQATSTFLYYGTNGNLLTFPGALLTDVRYVEIRLIINIDPVRSPGEFLLHSGVAPRNLKDNL